MRSSLYACFAILAFVAAPLNAAVVSTDGVVDVISSPISIANGVLEHDQNLRMLPERQRVKLPSGGQFVNATPTNRADHTWDGPPYDAVATIPAGVLVSSYYLHFDSVQDSEEGTYSAGAITFDADILGIIVGENGLDSTDGRFGVLNSANYGQGEANRGLEGTADRTILSVDKRTLHLEVGVTSFSDNIRVLTVAANADFDGNGFVDGGDFLIWQRQAGLSTGAVLSDGDSNADGDVDQFDLQNWKLQFGTSVYEPAAIISVPEPSSCLLACCSLSALLVLRRWPSGG